MTRLVLPDTTTFIGQSAFLGCSNLSGEIVLPDSLSSTGYHSFMSTGVKRVVFGSGMKTANNWLFRDCTSLESVSWNQSITYIGDSLFYGCTALAKFENEFPAGLTGIGANAFYNTPALEGDNLDLRLANVTAIGITAFQNSGIRSVEIGGGLKSLGNVFFMCAKLESVVLNEGTVSISGDCFPYCTSLTNLVLPSTITSIGSSREMGKARLHVYWRGAPEDLAPFTKGGCAVIDNISHATHHLRWDDKAAWEKAVENGFGNAQAALSLPASMFGKGTWGWNKAHEVLWWQTPVAQVGDATYKTLAEAVAAAKGAAISLLPENVAESTDERVSLGKGEWFAVADDGHVLGYEPEVEAADGGWKLAVSRQVRDGAAVVVYKSVGPATLITVK